MSKGARFGSTYTKTGTKMSKGTEQTFLQRWQTANMWKPAQHPKPLGNANRSHSEPFYYLVPVRRATELTTNSGKNG